ncbi:unnamed protein product [Acanthoscelides obtectus]|uniref:Trimethylguanosine synthase n=1 Tax=Acanthoscelides obtectus TaxID=200917 RepID=A0A9P0KI74_ACAOB|nr:unnamed protein product [Acanthoscelides obtectus]CAK1666718.1 Trimethylguanosine synthase [Acanthoscelides obtectus]
MFQLFSMGYGVLVFSDSSTNSEIAEEVLPTIKGDLNIKKCVEVISDISRKVDLKSTKIKSDSLVVNTLSKIFDNLNMSSDEENSEASEQENEEMGSEAAQMEALGLPTSFCKSKNPPSVGKSSVPNKNIDKSDSFNAGRNRVRAAFNILGIEFQEDAEEKMTGRVEYIMKHIRHQNRQLKIRANKRPKHLYFDEDGNALDSKDNADEMLPGILSDDSDNRLSSCDEETILIDVTTSKQDEKTEVSTTSKRKKRKRSKLNLPPEIKENEKLRKYWKRRFSLFSKFDQGIKLDEESWYSVTPELVAKHAAERCRCDLIIDAFCGAGGNAIQFASTCKKVIAIDIDPKKIEMAQNNATVYGVEEKIEFIVGDFFQLAPYLKADVVFLSPPWGGPSYSTTPIYDLETMLQPFPLSKLLEAAREISENVAIFLPRNSNTCSLICAAGPNGKVEIEQDFLNKKLISITAYYSELINQN